MMSTPAPTLVARVAHQLAALSLSAEDGSYIGAEDDLLERLGVSRPTLRQAAKIAETERMISVRRGVRGGFYAARPDVSDAITTLNRYLRLQGAGLKHMQVVRGTHLEGARLASACADEALRTRLRELLAELNECNDATAMMRFDTRFTTHVALMSGNPVVQLITGLAYAFGRDEQGVYLYSAPAHRAEVRRHFLALGEAILAGDAELAEFHMNRRLSVIHGWINAADPKWFRPMGEL
jgi:GntR family transcriptional regulator, transcriptional repressor for pyruvate dehydrogenase complex